MSFEVNVLPVGDESQSGDAIAIKFGNYSLNPDDYNVVIIDGGFVETGERLVKAINEKYGTNRVDLIVLTHPDSDHVGGLRTVIEQMDVGELWMHRPWLHSDDIKTLATDRNAVRQLTAGGLKKSLEAAYDLEQLALERNIPIIEPYQGLEAFNGVLTVLGPEEDFYHALVSDFGKSTATFTEKAKRLIREVWHYDELVDPEPNATSPRNNSSVITLFNFGEREFLFTGDAGVEGLTAAADYADDQGIDLRDVYYFQVPHHGSKRNLGPSILDRIIGPIVERGVTIEKCSFVSAAVNGKPKHPSALVENALVRRGVQTCAPTRGSTHFFTSRDIPPYPNSGSITMLDLQEEHEDES